MTVAAVAARGRQALEGGSRDVALALLLAVFAELDVLLSSDWRGPAAVNAVVVAAMALALAWRRRRPLAVLAIAVGGVVLLSLAFGSSQTWSFVFILVVAVYSAAAHGSQPLVAATLAAAGVAVFTLRDPEIDTFGEAVWSSTLLGLTLLAGLTGRALQARSAALEQRAERLDREEEQLAAAAAAAERRRIARELHDIVSHSLGVVVLQAGAAEQVLERDAASAREALTSIRTIGREAIGEMGTLLGLLDEPPGSTREPQPSLADLHALVTRTSEAGLDVELAIEGRRRALPAALELSAFRVVQEGLTNALKHAGPAHVRVVLRYGEDELQVEVADNGKGVGDGAGARRGLAGLRERVAVFGGRLEAGERHDGGWRVKASFPASP